MSSLLISAIIACFFNVNLPQVSFADDDMEFVVPSGASSETYERPESAEYFWWDSAPEVKVEVTFRDGSKEIASSKKTFSKRITLVKFINPTKTPQKIILKTGF